MNLKGAQQYQELINMKNIFNIIIFSLILWVGSSKISFAATGPADIYKITMRKVELCTASTGVTSCENAVVIGSGDRIIDIAAVGEGAVAAAYGDPALLPLGTTYTHMRVTIDRKFSVRSKAAISGGDANTDACVTIATTDAMYAGDQDANKYTHKPAVAEGGTRAEMNMYLVNDQYTRCNNAACNNTTADQDQNYDQGVNSSKHQSQHADGSSDDDHILIYELTSPYTVALISPTIDISFGTSAAISVNNNGSNLCQIWAEEPAVTITIK